MGNDDFAGIMGQLDIINRQRGVIDRLEKTISEQNELIVQAVEAEAQYEAAIRERDERIVMLKGLLLDVRVTLSHAQTFIASREKMHPDGVALYQADIKRIDAALADHSRAGI